MSSFGRSIFGADERGEVSGEGNAPKGLKIRSGEKLRKKKGGVGRVAKGDISYSRRGREKGGAAF